MTVGDDTSIAGTVDAAAVDWRGRTEVRNVLWEGMLRTEAGNTNFGVFASFRKCVVARVKVFAFLDSISCEVLQQAAQRTLSLLWRRSFLLGSLP